MHVQCMHHYCLLPPSLVILALWGYMPIYLATRAFHLLFCHLPSCMCKPSLLNLCEHTHTPGGQFLGGEGGGGGHGPSQFWPTTFFPRDFYTPNIRTDVEKQNKSIYYNNEFEHIQCEKSQLVTMPSSLEYSRPHHI